MFAFLLYLLRAESVCVHIQGDSLDRVWLTQILVAQRCLSDSAK